MLSPQLQAQVDRAAQILRDGGLVAMPTETVYGLAANALDPQAVARIFEMKQRPHFDPLIVHAADADTAFALTHDAPDAARKLAHHFWPGPLTLVLPKQSCVPDIVTSGLQSVAVRVPDHPVAQGLIRAAGVPLAAPSANRFGSISPTVAAHVRAEFGESLTVIDGGPCRAGIESTVVSFVEEGGAPVLLRPGAIEVEQIEALLGVTLPRMTGSPKVMSAPGMLPRHYAPRTPLILSHQLEPRMHGQRIGYLAFSQQPTAKYDAVQVLSETGNLIEAAANLFGAMRRLDEMKLDLIVAELAPPRGLGIAINDRLTRAGAANDEGDVESN